MDVAGVVTTMLGGRLAFRVEAYDGSFAEPTIASGANGVTLRINSPDALTRVITHPGELGLARAYVAGDIDVEGDLDALFSLKTPPLTRLLGPANLRALYALLGAEGLRPLPAPPIEAAPRGLLHSRARDRRAVSHHYDVSNRFYEMVLGPSMTYSCAVFRSSSDSLESAQSRKLDLVARKLGLGPGSRLLDVGCGWGAMGLHAAREYGARVVGVTLSSEQQRYATLAAAAAGLSDRVEFRLQDYRDVRDGPFDAISSIGMSEHVGRRGLPAYTRRLVELLVPGGRLLNHAIGRPVYYPEDPAPSRLRTTSRQVQIALGLRRPSRTASAFIERYVFPDGELHELGTMVTMFQSHGFEVRHVESLREHYALTLRAWVSNLEANWADALAEVGEARARVWRLYMAGSAVGFEANHLQVHQVLSVKGDAGSSKMGLRSDFEPKF